jgi:tetratricopeptide (TPR) repeat protein
MMKNKLGIGILVILCATVSTPVWAENLADLRQLLSTKECFNCNLSGSGLVMANLAGARLSGANLAGANLSRANLTGADLSGVNLSGASLYGANLTGANLIGANLNGVDLRDAYLHNAILIGVSLDTAYLQGVIGIPNYAGTPDQFVRWGMVEANKGNYQQAIAHYNQALSINVNFPYAYLNRALARYRLGDEGGAIQDSEIASKIFERQDNTIGVETSQKLIEGIEIIKAIRDKPERQLGIERVLGSIGSVLMRLLF